MTSLDNVNLGPRGKCFSICPLCGKEGTVTFHHSLIKSHLYCNYCGAKWSVHFKLGEFVGATLVEPNKIRSRKDLLQKEYEPKYWLEMAQKLIEENEAARIRRQ
jgi:hypothetical protein